MFKDQVIEILQDVTKTENITEDMVLGTDVLISSINAMKLLYDLEEKLEIKELPVEVMYEAETVGDLVKIVEEARK